MKSHSCLAAFFLLVSLIPSRAEDAAARLVAEYEKRKAAALQPIETWFDNEVKRLNEVASRGTDAALLKAARQLSLGRFLTSKKWEWAGGGAPFAVAFEMDGSGGSRWATFRWEAISEKDLLLVRDTGQEMSFALGVNGVWLSSRDFDGTPKKSEIRVAGSGAKKKK